MQILIHRNIETVNRVVAIVSILLGMLGTFGYLYLIYNYMYGSSLFYYMMPVSVAVPSLLLNILLMVSGFALFFKKLYFFKLYLTYCLSSLMAYMTNLLFVYFNFDAPIFDNGESISFLPELIIGAILFYFITNKRIRNHFNYNFSKKMWSSICLASLGITVIPYLIFMKSFWW